MFSLRAETTRFWIEPLRFYRSWIFCDKNGHSAIVTIWIRRYFIFVNWHEGWGYIFLVTGLFTFSFVDDLALVWTNKSIIIYVLSHLVTFIGFTTLNFKRILWYNIIGNRFILWKTHLSADQRSIWMRILKTKLTAERFITKTQLSAEVTVIESC